MGGGGTPGTAVGGTTHIHYDSHASNESKKVKRESPTGKRKQTVLRGAAGGGRDEDGPPPPGSHPPRGGCTTRGASTSNAAGWDPGRAHLASRNFLSRLGRSWLRRRRNQRSTWRTEQPLFLDSISTSAWGGRRGRQRRVAPPPRHPLGVPPHLFGLLGGGGVELLQHCVWGGSQPDAFLHTQQPGQWGGHVPAGGQTDPQPRDCGLTPPKAPRIAGWALWGCPPPSKWPQVGCQRRGPAWRCRAAPSPPFPTKPGLFPTSGCAPLFAQQTAAQMRGMHKATAVCGGETQHPQRRSGGCGQAETPRGGTTNPSPHRDTELSLRGVEPQNQELGEDLRDDTA